MNKSETLAKFLNVTTNEIQEDTYHGSFTHSNQEYLVLTDDEADKVTRENIEETAWAFKAEFIIQHCKNYEDMSQSEYSVAVESLKQAQNNQCESLNGLVHALIDNFDEFVTNAIETDGRGHFIASYDGQENELNGYYIYRVN